MRRQLYIDEALAMASEVRYQTPLIAVEWRQKECQCGARARFPGPCAECAGHRLAIRVGEDLARQWIEACKEQQRLWKMISDAAAVSANKAWDPHQTPGAPGLPLSSQDKALCETAVLDSGRWVAETR